MIVLTTCEKGNLHSTLEKAGITTYANPVKSVFSFLYYFKQARFLMKFSVYALLLLSVLVLGAAQGAVERGSKTQKPVAARILDWLDERIEG